MNEQTNPRTNDLTTSLMNVRLTHLTMKAALDAVTKRVAQKHYSEPLTVFTPNAEQMVQAQKSTAFLDVLNTATVSVPDSAGLVAADWWRAACTGTPWNVRERVAGIDLAENMLAQACERGWKVVLVGGVGNVSSRAATALKKRFEGLQVVGIEIGEIGFRQIVRSSDRRIAANINELKPDLLLVGLGAPKQEFWVEAHKDQLHTQVVMVVGGAIDVWAGVVTRAPRWMRTVGLEWLWRLGSEPSRWRRQLRLVEFFGFMLRGKY